MHTAWEKSRSHNCLFSKHYLTAKERYELLSRKSMVFSGTSRGYWIFFPINLCLISLHASPQWLKALLSSEPISWALPMIFSSSPTEPSQLIPIPSNYSLDNTSTNSQSCMLTIWRKWGLASSTQAKPIMLNPSPSLSCGAFESPCPQPAFSKLLGLYYPKSSPLWQTWVKLAKKLQWEINTEKQRIKTFDG